MSLAVSLLHAANPAAAPGADPAAGPQLAIVGLGAGLIGLACAAGAALFRLRRH